MDWNKVMTQIKDFKIPADPTIGELNHQDFLILLKTISSQLSIITKILTDIDNKFPSSPSKITITFDKPTEQ